LDTTSPRNSGSPSLYDPAVALVGGLVLWLTARRNPVTPHNVNRQAGMSKYVDVGALWRVTLHSLGFGAGMVALYALGVVSFARGRRPRRTGPTSTAGTPGTGQAA